MAKSMDGPRAQQIQSLLKHPAWPALVDEITELEDRYYERLKNELKRGKIPETRDFDFQRGILFGMNNVVRRAKVALETYENALAEERKLSER